MKTKRFLKILFSLLVGCLLVLLAGCTSTSNEVKIGPEENGSQVELQPGQMLSIQLPSNPSTGYGWHIAEIEDSIIRQVGEVEFVDNSEGQVLGAAGLETLRFEALASGEANLVLTYDRVWEDVEPEDTFEVTVVVQ